jgi:hypothetical protein
MLLVVLVGERVVLYLLPGPYLDPDLDGHWVWMQLRPPMVQQDVQTKLSLMLQVVSSALF